jgi:hypothetical protein
MEGYGLMLLDLKEFEVSKILHPTWAKLPALARAFDQYPSSEWVWWLDIDAIIMTSHIDLYEHILSPSALRNRLLQGELILTNDRVPLNAKEPITTGEVGSQYLNQLTFRTLIHPR